MKIRQHLVSYWVSGWPRALEMYSLEAVSGFAERASVTCRAPRMN